MEEVRGSVERITFYNSENGFAVFRVDIGQRDPITVVGPCSPLVQGQSICARGDWVEDKRFGKQLRATAIEVENPKSREGILKFLSSGFLSGIGEAYAKRIIDRFGEESLEIIRKEPMRLREIPGIGKKRALRAARALREQGALAELLVFLQGHGLGVAMAQKLIRLYGADVVTVVKENPYRLVDEVDGMGFQSADDLAQKLGLQKDSPQRLHAAVSYILKRASLEGHLYLPREMICEELGRILETEIAWSEDFPVVVEGDRVYSPYHYQLEVELAQAIKTFLGGPFDPLSTVRIDDLQKQETVILSEGQRKALEVSLSSKLSVITGGPGTGKSTLTKILIKCALAQGKRVALAAPTGRAAQRLEEICGSEARTLHRLLKFDPVRGIFQHGPDSPLDVDLLLVDESSMLDLVMLRHLFRALLDTSQIVFVGDRDQLPPVGVGSFFADLIESGLAAVSVLDKIYRQGPGSGIVEAAHRINSGEEIREASLGEDFYFIEEDDPKVLVEKIIEVVARRIPKRFSIDTRDIQVLAPMYRGILGIDQLNLELQKALNPDPTLRFQKGEAHWGLGDRIVVLRNNYEKEVFNGDLGIIASIDLEEEELFVNFDRGHSVKFSFEETRDLQLAYCISIHKSQGSEFPAVVIPLSTQHYRMLRRKLLYTAITRSRRLCILIGSRRAFSIALKNFQEQPRFTALVDRLRSKA